MRKLITAFIALTISLFTSTTVSYAEQFKVLRVVDGDTIDIEYHGKKERVRLLCVNTPESVHPDKKQNIPMGKVASQYAKDRLSGRSVSLEFETRKRGNYGRLLAYVFVDGHNFNLELVRQGLSPYYTKYGFSGKYDQQFRQAEKIARKEGLNIWGDPELTQKYLRLKSKWGQYRSENQSSGPVYRTQNKEWSFVASRKSKVFHRPGCRYARKISPTNLIGYKVRDEAIQDDRRPCKVCKP